MIKADIVKKVAADLNLRDSEALAVVDNILEAMKEIICEDERLEIRDFGVFKVKQRKPRTGRNPKDKKTYPIPARKVVTFKIGKELRLNAVADEDAQSAEAASDMGSDD